MDRPLSQEALAARRRSVSFRVVFSLLALAIGLFAFRHLFVPTLDADEIRTAKVTRGTIKSTINAGGVVEPLVEETISSVYDTQLVKLFVKPGQAVEQGEPLMQLDNLSIKLELSNIKEKIALKDNLAKTNQLSMERAINEVRSKVQLLEVDIEGKKALAERLRRLNKNGVVSNQNLLEADLNVKKSNIEHGQLLQSINDIRSSSASEIDGIRLEKQILEKELLEKQRLLDESTVRATRSGILSWVKQEEGSSIAIREPLAKIADTTQFKISANLSDFYSSQLVSGMEVEVTYREHTAAGKLETLAPTIENGVMKLSIALDNPDADFLRNNLRVDVGLITETVGDVHRIPKGPALKGRGLQSAFIIRDGVAYKNTLTIGASSSDYFQVVEGATEGEEVIISDVSDFLHLDKIKIN